LITDIVRYAAADLVDFVHRPRKEGYTAGSGGYLLQRTSRTPLFFFSQ